MPNSANGTSPGLISSPIRAAPSYRVTSRALWSTVLPPPPARRGHRPRDWYGRRPPRRASRMRSRSCSSADLARRSRENARAVGRCCPVLRDCPGAPYQARNRPGGDQAACPRCRSSRRAASASRPGRLFAEITPERVIGAFGAEARNSCRTQSLSSLRPPTTAGKTSLRARRCACVPDWCRSRYPGRNVAKARNAPSPIPTGGEGDQASSAAGAGSGRLAEHRGSCTGSRTGPRTTSRVPASVAAARTRRGEPPSPAGICRARGFRHRA